MRKLETGAGKNNLLTEVVEKLSIIKILRENRWYLLMVTLGVILLYANSVNGAFVSDDYATILNNPELKQWQYAFRGGASTYFIHSLIAMVFGVAPLQYHLSNLVLFLVTIYLAFVMVHHLFGSSVAMISIGLFAAHPIHVEAVSWISGKPYLLIAMYVLAAYLLFIKFLETEKLIYLGGMAMAFLFGFLTDNPRPFTLFLLMPLHLWLTKTDLRKNRWFKYWPMLLVPVGIVAAFAWPHVIERVNVVNAGVNASESIFYNPFFQYPTGLAKYLQILWAPVDLTLYHTMYVFPVWLNWSILLTYVGLIVYGVVFDRRVAYSLVFIFVAILPSMMPVKVSWLVAERYAYLASLGFCLFLGVLIYELAKKSQLIAGSVVITLLVLYSVRLVLRNIDWQTNHNLWVNTCQVSPNSHNAWNNIGDDYDKLGQYENAIKGFTQSTIVKPNYADAFHNRANIFYKIGRLDLARDSYQTAVYYNPGLYQTYLSLVNIDLIEKKMDLAVEHAKTAISFQPNDPGANYVLAVVYSQKGETLKSMEILERLVRAYPGFRQAQEALLQLKNTPKSK